jgi:hypothetical protein
VDAISKQSRIFQYSLACHNAVDACLGHAAINVRHAANTTIRYYGDALTKMALYSSNHFPIRLTAEMAFFLSVAQNLLL